MNQDAAVRYCRQKSAPAGSNLYYSLLYIPARLQNRLFALHALYNELDDILMECSDPGVARVKLAWWFEELANMQSHRPRHPVSTLMSGLFAKKLPRMNLHGLISYFEQQINFRQPENYNELMDQMMQGPGLLWKLSCDVTGHSSIETSDLIVRMGCLFGYFQVLQNLPTHIQFQRVYFPRVEWDEYGMTTGLFALQVNRMQDELEALIRKVPSVDQNRQLPALIMSNILCLTCQEIQRRGYNLDKERISLTPLRKTWIAWRTRRRII